MTGTACRQSRSSGAGSRTSAASRLAATGANLSGSRSNWRPGRTPSACSRQRGPRGDKSAEGDFDSRSSAPYLAASFRLPRTAPCAGGGRSRGEEGGRDQVFPGGRAGVVRAGGGVWRASRRNAESPSQIIVPARCAGTRPTASYSSTALEDALVAVDQVHRPRDNSGRPPTQRRPQSPCSAISPGRPERRGGRGRLRFCLRPRPSATW